MLQDGATPYLFFIALPEGVIARTKTDVSTIQSLVEAPAKAAVDAVLNPIRHSVTGPLDRAHARSTPSPTW